MWNLKLGFVWFEIKLSKKGSKKRNEQIERRTRATVFEVHLLRFGFETVVFEETFEEFLACLLVEPFRDSFFLILKWENLVLAEYIVNPSWLIHFQFFSLPHSLFSIELFVPQAYQVFPIRLPSVSWDTDIVSENETKRRAFWIRLMFLQSKNFFISSYDPSGFSHPFAFSTFFLPSSSFYSSYNYLFFFSNENPSGSSRLLNVMFDLLKWGKDSANRTWKILVTENLEDFFLYIILMDT